MMKPAEILRGALELLGPNGDRWTRGALIRNPQGVGFGAEGLGLLLGLSGCSYCVAGAVDAAALMGGSTDKERVAALQVLERELESLDYTALEDTGGIIVSFNDDHACDFGEVRRALLSAIGRAEAEGDS